MEKDASEPSGFGSCAGQGAGRCTEVKGTNCSHREELSSWATSQDGKRQVTCFPPSLSLLESTLFGCSRVSQCHLTSGLEKMTTTLTICTASRVLAVLVQ